MSESRIIGQDYNCETGEITPIYLTPEIDAFMEQERQHQKMLELEMQAKIDAKESAIEKFKKLGLSEKEISAILG